MKRIVLIDSNQTDLTLLWHLVRRIKGYEAANFTNPKDALEWCLENETELIIVNYMMPEMDGIAFITQLRQSPQNISVPVLMEISPEYTDVRQKAFELGVTDFINKPIDKTEFMVRVQNTLVLSSNQKKLTNQTAWLKDEVLKATEEIRNREQEVIFRLTKAAEYRDPETGGHIKRMAHYSRHIAMQLGLSAEEQNLLLEAAPMHDIGKVGIPDSILLKPGKLDHSEFEIMKEHAQIGYDMLKDSDKPLLKASAIIAYHHQEKYDGSGYPQQLQGEQIHIYGRITAIADVFDALGSQRVYKKAWSDKEIFKLFKNESGKHFDPVLIQIFFDNIDEFLKIRDDMKDIV